MATRRHRVSKTFRCLSGRVIHRVNWFWLSLGFPERRGVRSSVVTSTETATNCMDAEGVDGA
jgi:hypothetical protein